MAVYRAQGRSVWMMDFVFRGQRIKQSTGTKSKTLAKEMERKRRRDLEEGAAGIRRRAQPRLLSAAAEEWFDSLRPTIRPATESYIAYRLKFLLPALGARLVQDIDGGDVARYQRARQAAGASPRTINMEVGILRQILKRARLWANIQPDVKMLPEPDSPGVAITHEQESRLLAECARSHSRALYPFAVLAIETGARRGVIRTLQWRRVDFARRCLTWGQDKTPAGTGRVVPLSPRAMAVLETWAANFPGRQPDHYVFPAEKVAGAGQRGPQGRRQDAQFASGLIYATDPTRPLGAVTSAWESARQRAGVRVRIHDLRHLAASRMLDAGVPLAKVAKILGWAPATMVEMAARYGHFRLEELRSAVETISPEENAKIAAGSPTFPHPQTTGAPMSVV